VKTVLSILLALLSSGLGAADWPQWRGPARDGRLAGFTEPSAWPEALRLRWKVTVGEGHASPIVAGERVFVFSRQGEHEVLQALDLGGGAPAWRHSYAAPYTMNMAARSHGKGPKATPVVDGGAVCTFGISGILSCFDTASGRPLWRKQFDSEYPATSPLYGVAMSPLVDEGRLIAHVGGSGNGALTAFDVRSGEVVWKWTGDGPAYASPVVATLGGVRQLLTFSESALVGVAVEDGALLWRVPFTTSYAQNAVTPLVHGGVIFYGGLDQPLRAMRPVRSASGWSVAPAWQNEALSVYMSTPVLVGDRIFGLSHRRRGQLFAVETATGRTLWLSDARLADNAALVASAGMLFVLTTNGELLLLPSSADTFAPLRRYRVAETPTWAHPAFVAGGVLVKDASTLAFWGFEAR
jgi:outer membrane protein assembly factor BamB